MLKQQHQLFVALLVLVDGIVIALAACLAWFLRLSMVESWPITRWEDVVKQSLVVFVVPLGLFSIRWFGLYLPRRDRSLLNEIKQIAKASLVCMLMLLASLYAFDSSVFRPVAPLVNRQEGALDAGRVQLGALMVILPICLMLHRMMFRLVLRRMRRKGWNQRHVAIIGCGRLGQIVASTLGRNSWTGIRVSYFIGHQDHTRRVKCLDRPVMGGLSDLEKILSEHKPDAVYVALPMARAAELPSILLRLDKFAVDVRVVPDLNPRYLPHSMAVNELDGMPILSYRECPTSGMDGLSKRVLDLIGAVVAMIIFAPLMVLVGLLVRASGPGPVIFRQRRVSLAGEVFDIYKFRTMYHVEDELAGERSVQGRMAAPASPRGEAAAAERIAGWTDRNDPRITPIGRWMRRTSLDELPQLLNVFRGEMSLVGPRPERPELIARFREDWRGYMLRQHVKAGMTGWAQVNGHRGQTSLKKRLQYDLFYIRHWSLGFDLKILWLTLFRGFAHRNAH
ncbi:MAG: exopolysaccharide biosynthesis polyprenyl glycosylphosphotransferase [Pyrinomonadaceae bacterium]|nr:exopolysaccharide biosynthesis polyprenyl glycosylphosphotransferase [Phycisphaerales bacterium]